MSEPATAADMNTLVAVAIAPCGTGDELSAEVAEVVRVIRESGLPNRTTSMFTETTLISRPIWYSAPKTRWDVPWAMW